MSIAKHHALAPHITHHWKKITVSDLDFAPATGLENGKLLIHRDELISRLQSDPNIRNVKVDIVHPGESVRIVPVKDVIEPRLSLIPGYQVFPGVLSGWDPDTNRIPSGEIVSVCGMVVTTVGSIVGFQEGVIDMSGPGAKYSLFSQNHHLVLDITVQEGIGRHHHKKTQKMSLFRAAVYIARHE